MMDSQEKTESLRPKPEDVFNFFINHLAVEGNDPLKRRVMDMIMKHELPIYEVAKLNFEEAKTKPKREQAIARDRLVQVLSPIFNLLKAEGFSQDELTNPGV